MALRDALRGAGTGETAQNYARFNAYLRAAANQRRTPSSIASRTDRAPGAAHRAPISGAKSGGGGNAAGIPDFRVTGRDYRDLGGFASNKGQRDFFANLVADPNLAGAVNPAPPANDVRDLSFEARDANDVAVLMDAIRRRLGIVEDR